MVVDAVSDSVTDSGHGNRTAEYFVGNAMNADGADPGTFVKDAIPESFPAVQVVIIIKLPSIIILYSRTPMVKQFDNG